MSRVEILIDRAARADRGHDDRDRLPGRVHRAVEARDRRRETWRLLPQLGAERLAFEIDVRVKLLPRGDGSVSVALQHEAHEGDAFALGHGREGRSGPAAGQGARRNATIRWRRGS